jgi:hypothetical protein
MFKVGDEVGWRWASSIATGTVIDIIYERHQIMSKGTVITRNGTPEDPAIVIESNNGALVIKLAHELQKLINN